MSTEYADDQLTLKFGRIKGYKAKNPATRKLLEEYYALGVSASVLAQTDTVRQKELLCEIIDSIGQPVYMSWSGEYISPEKAKEYILTYDS